MTTNLPTTIEEISYDEIAELTGMPQTSSNYITQLRINRDPEDDDSNSLPLGNYCVWGGDGVGMVFGKPVNFRAFINAYQIKRFNPESRKYDARTIIFKNWKEEKIDSIGGVDCGKIPFKQQNQLTDSEKALQKHIKTTRLVYGLVSFEGVTAKKEPHTITNLPCLWKTQGGAFIPVGDALGLFARKKLMPMKFNLVLNTKREKNGATVYYSVDVAPDFNTVMPVGPAEMEHLQKFIDIIAMDNQEIMKEHQAAKANDPKVVDAVYEDVKELMADLNDELPDNMKA